MFCKILTEVTTTLLMFCKILTEVTKTSVMFCKILTEVTKTLLMFCKILTEVTKTSVMFRKIPTEDTKTSPQANLNEDVLKYLNKSHKDITTSQPERGWPLKDLNRNHKGIAYVFQYLNRSFKILTPLHLCPLLPPLALWAPATQATETDLSQMEGIIYVWQVFRFEENMFFIALETTTNH